MTYRPAAMALALVAIGALSSCGTSDGSNGSSAPETVVVKDMAFRPAALTVHPGDTVTWKFDDRFPHNVQGVGPNDTTLESPIIDRGRWSFHFTAPGEYHYHCQLHPEMRGTITVR